MEKAYFNDLEGFFSNGDLFFDDFNFNSDDFSDKNRMGNPIFKAIGYPSKIFYENIRKYISGYTKEGGVVLDSCAGSGSTGIAALIEGRKAVLIDNSPLAINMEYNLLNYVDLKELDKAYELCISRLAPIINDIYYTKMSDGRDGVADVIIASNVYTCPSCGKEIVLYKNETGKRSEYKCPECGEIINIAQQAIKELQIDKRRPVEVTISPLTGKGKREIRLITEEDKKIWDQKFIEYNRLYGDLWAPSEQIVYNRCYPRVGGWPGFPIHSPVSALFPRGNLLALKILNNYIENEIEDVDIRAFMKFIFTETLFRTSSRLFTGSGIKNVYHIPPVGKEQNVLTVFARKYRDIIKAKSYLQAQIDLKKNAKNIRIIQKDAKKINLPDNSVDYVFIDPPYGGMVPYAELNLFYSAWLHEKEDFDEEIIIPMDFEKKEGYVEKWGSYIEAAFGEAVRTLKPGGHFTVAFHSTFSNIWNELKDIMTRRLGLEFVNIVENERGTTFHTNHINDTNPVSAFITYRKTKGGEKAKQQIRTGNIFEELPASFWKGSRSFREVQSEIIVLANELDYEIPSEKDILNWLKNNCDSDGKKYSKR